MARVSATCVLLPFLGDSDGQIRRQVAWGLQYKFRDGRPCAGDIEALSAVVGDPYSQDSVVKILGDIKDPRAVPRLIEELRAYKTTRVCPVCKALAAIGDPRAVEPLIEFIQARNGDVDPIVIETLTQLMDLRAVPAITPLLKSPSPKLRIAAMMALATINECQAMAEVRSSLLDEPENVRQAAAQLAAKCKDFASVDLLIRMLQFDIKAAKALGDIGDQRAVEPLLLIVKVKQQWGRRDVAHALGQLHDPRAVDALILALHDDTTTSELN